MFFRYFPPILGGILLIVGEPRFGSSLGNVSCLPEDLRFKSFFNANHSSMIVEPGL